MSNKINETLKPNSLCEKCDISMLYEISQILMDSENVKVALKKVLKTLSNYNNILKIILTIVDRTTGEIIIDEAEGLSEIEKQKGKYRLGEGITGKVVETGKPIVIPRISQEPLFLDKTGSRKNFNKDDITFICVPIKNTKEVIGTLSVDHFFDNIISIEENLQLFSIVTSMIAQAVSLYHTKYEENKLLQEENKRLHNELKDNFQPRNIIGKSNSMKEVYKLIEMISKTDSTVMILGESGSGKELVANAIHYNSDRANKPFIKFNCSALPENIIESELFGYEKGAFTGANQYKKGRFEIADGGTIFIDEIGEMTPTLQVKLLRVLQEREFEKLGGTETIKVNIRIITATNKDLQTLIKEGKFREDLYYRLNVFPIIVPALRERKSDILLLANHFVEKYSKKNRKQIKRISMPAIDILTSYSWPGNVRELENYIERAVILSNDDVIHSYHFPPTLQTAETSGTKYKGTLKEKLSSVEREIIQEALKSTNGNMAKASKEIGITERQMGLRIKKYHIDLKKFKTKKS